MLGKVDTQQQQMTMLIDQNIGNHKTGDMCNYTSQPEHVF